MEADAALALLIARLRRKIARHVLAIFQKRELRVLCFDLDSPN